jgi:hypothetical protein
VGRRSSVSWLIALTIAAGIGLAAFVVVPFRTCPTCRGLAKKLADPVTRTVRYRIDCPECSDRCSVTQLRHLKGSLVTPQVSRLLQSQRENRQTEFLPDLDQVSTAGGRDPAEVSGSKYFPARKMVVAAVFVRAQENPLVLVLLRGLPTLRSKEGTAGLVLVDMDGKVLDYVHIAVNSWWGSIAPDLVSDGTADGAVAAIDAQCDLIGELQATADTERPPNIHAVFDGNDRTLPPRAGLRRTWRVALKGGRFELLPSPTAANR